VIRPQPAKAPVNGIENLSMSDLAIWQQTENEANFRIGDNPGEIMLEDIAAENNSIGLLPGDRLSRYDLPLA
jgi:hypothetical protein